MRTDCTCIVTGCTGFVGNVLTKKLLDEGCRVRGFARNAAKADYVFKNAKPEFVFGDITNPDDVEKLFEGDGPFIVIHTAAKVTIGEGSSRELYDVTVKGTQNILDCAVKHHAEKFIQISSTEAIARDCKTEESLTDYRPDPQNSRKGYARAKAIADTLVTNAVHKYELNASILFLSSVLGPGDYTIGHMSQMMIDYLNGKLPASVKGGYNDFDVRDLAAVLPAVIEHSNRGEGYIFANRPDKIDEILQYVSEFSGRKPLRSLPLWVAYLGLPFLWIFSKISGKRALYTRGALASLRADADFPIQKSKDTFGYSPRPLRETVIDHIRFLESLNKVKL